MDVGDTQLIDDSPQRSPSRSSVSGESMGSDGPLHEPQQLLYTQLLDQYEGRRGNSRKPQRLDIDMETQLIEEHNFDDFRKNEGMIIPSEDEASKETQLVHGDEVHSGSSSGKDGEVDSGLSPLSAAFRDKPSHWQFTNRDRSVERIAGRASQLNFPYRNRYLGETQLLPDDDNGEAHNESAKEPKFFADMRAVVGGCPGVQNRDGDVPHFLRDFDPNRQDYGRQRTVGNWHEVIGQSDGCNQDRGWDAAVGGIQLVDSDASTEDEENTNIVFNTDLSYPRDVQLSQNVNSRLSTHVSSNFCSQDLNKSPEPEPTMDEWDEVQRADPGLGRIDQGGSNVGLVNTVDQVELGSPAQFTPVGGRTNEGPNGRTARPAPLSFRTAGSIRAMSLHTSALRASSCSSSGRQGSKSEEIQKVSTIEMQSDVHQKGGGSSGDTTAMSRVSLERGGPSASFVSVLSSSRKYGDSQRLDKDPLGGKVMDYSDADAKARPKAGTSIQAGTSSLSELDVSQPGENHPGRARKIFLEDQNEIDKETTQTSKEENANSQSPPASKRINLGKGIKAEPLPSKENHSSLGEKSLERRSSFGSGLFSTGSDMGYLSPGEDSQARALTMVDKLVWLNAIGLPQDLQLEEEKSPPRGPTNAKSVLQSRVQVAEAKSGMDDPFGVFDWVDSQSDEAGTFFGGGGVKPSAGRGTSKGSIASGQPKQSVSGSKKGGVTDVFGIRSKKAERLSEKEKIGKSIPNTDKQKGLVSKYLSPAIENTREHRGDRSGSGAGAIDSRQDHARTESTLDLAKSHLDRVGSSNERRSGHPDKGLNKTGAIDTPIVDKERLVSTAEVPHQQRSKTLSQPARFERSPKSTALEHNIEASKSSNVLPKVHDVQKRPGERSLDKQEGEPGVCQTVRMNTFPDPRTFHGTKASLTTETSEGNVYGVLQEISAPAKMEEGECLQVSNADLSYQVWRCNRIQIPENGFERVPRTLKKVGSLAPLQGDGNSELSPYVRVGHIGKFFEVNPDQSPRNGKIPENANDVENLPQGRQLFAPQQQSYEEAAELRSVSERVEKYHESLKPTMDGMTAQAIFDYRDSKQSGHLDGSTLASAKVPPTDLYALSGMQDAQIGPDDPLTVETATELLNNSPMTRSGDGPVGEDVHENGTITPADHENGTITPADVLSNNDIEDHRTPKIEEEMQSVSEKGQMAIRRGRSQTRYSAKQLESADRLGGSNNLIGGDKGRGRRVTWAGPLEQVLRQSIGIRSPRSFRQQNEARDDDIGDSAADSSSQDEETEDVKEEIKIENGMRKRNSEAFDMIGSRDDDLDKIKRRFNMSDAAVARLLGTDDEEDADLNQAAAVKVRSLSHIQPEADGNGSEIAAPYFRRVGKGLRSVRIRNEEGSRRPRPFACPDRGKLDGEEVDLPYAQNVVKGNMYSTTTVETHPSDNEFMTGRRRMRSIADVSFPNLQQTTPGRPPIARGLRRRRGRQIVISPPEAKAELTDDDLADVPPRLPSSISPVIGRFRGKGGPRSIRKRREPESETTPAVSEVSMSPNSSKEASPTGFKRRKRTGTTSVLLSHGLNEDTIKQQRKIVAKLGGRVASSASECTHFVADKFVRTGNMLESMAAGKPVVDIEWLETCLDANRFVDEQDFILQDTKKEEEMGFSMISTLTAARQRPLLQGIRVYITPGTSPGPDSLARIIKSAGGQVVDEYFGPPADGEQDSDFCVVLSSEEELEDCIPLLEQGAKVYTPELILSGVTSYHLDFSNDQLFKNFATRRRRGSSSRRTV